MAGVQRDDQRPGCDSVSGIGRRHGQLSYTGARSAITCHPISGYVDPLHCKSLAERCLLRGFGWADIQIALVAGSHTFLSL